MTAAVPGIDYDTYAMAWYDANGTMPVATVLRYWQLLLLSQGANLSLNGFNLNFRVIP